MSHFSEFFFEVIEEIGLVYSDDLLKPENKRVVICFALVTGCVSAFDGSTSERGLLHDVGASALRSVSRKRNIFHLFK